MNTKDKVILLYKTGMEKEHIAKQCETNKGYVSKIIKEYRKEIGSFKFYFNKFKSNETFRYFIVTLIISILLFGWGLYENRESAKLIKDNNQLLRGITEAISNNDTTVLKELLNELKENNQRYQEVIDELSEDFYKRGVIAKSLNNNREAKFFYEKVIELNSSSKLKDSHFWFEYGLILEAVRNEGFGIEAKREAAFAYEKALTLADKKGIFDAGSSLNRGRVLYELGLFYRNESYFTDSLNQYKTHLDMLKYDPSDFGKADANFGSGLDLIGLEEFSEAIPYLDNLNPSDEYYVDSLGQKAWALYKLSKLDESLNIVNLALSYGRNGFSNDRNFQMSLITKSFVLKEMGIREQNAENIVESFNTFKEVESDFIYVSTGLCIHGAELVGILSNGNESLANQYYWSCESQNIMKGINVYDITPYDTFVDVDWLYNLSIEKVS